MQKQTAELIERIDCCVVAKVQQAKADRSRGVCLCRVCGKERSGNELFLNAILRNEKGYNQVMAVCGKCYSQIGK